MDRGPSRQRRRSYLRGGDGAGDLCGQGRACLFCRPRRRRHPRALRGRGSDGQARDRSDERRQRERVGDLCRRYPRHGIGHRHRRAQLRQGRGADHIRRDELPVSDGRRRQVDGVPLLLRGRQHERPRGRCPDALHPAGTDDGGGEAAGGRKARGRGVSAPCARGS